MSIFHEPIAVSRSQRMRQKQGSHSFSLTPTWWIYIWIATSILPVLPLTMPLWQSALADTPYAFLVWIPVFSFFWAAWSLLQTTSYNDDVELNGIVGIPTILLIGSILLFAVKGNPAVFIGQSIGLLFWPLWALSLAWLIFGLGSTRRLIRPLAYLFLTWSPLYSFIVNFSNPPLEAISNVGMHGLTRVISWIQAMSINGNYLILHGGTWVPVQVSTVCSGSDSFLAMVILLPIILVLFQGSWLKKIVMIVIAGFLTILMNLLRLFTLVFALHYAGSNFTFGILHPILGFILFIVSIVILSIIGKIIGLKSHAMTFTKALKTPGTFHALIVLLITIVLTVALWPLYFWTAGSYSNPINVSTNKLSLLMPQVTGYERNLLGNYNEDAVLGPGSYGTAYAYSNIKGDYAMGEEWWTYNLNTLLSYGVNNCLLFHGDTILAKTSYTVRPGIQAEVYAMLLPASQIGGAQDLFEDVAYTYAVNFNGKSAYIRAEFATPVAYHTSAKSAVRQGQIMQRILNAQFHATSILPSVGITSALAQGQFQKLQHFTFFIKSFATSQLRSQSTPVQPS